ncbi:hypothetical protein GYMLUDRAFT_289503 [Collybiopsis luxurians FD-317 M1]|nr:hypothetical protein GYMLUDRAFT_289503 [Collybiopsis luxurians FD-317 M1]
MTSKDLLQQLRELRQLYTESTAKFKAAYEKRFGFAEDSEPGPVSPISPLQLTIPETFHAKVQQYRLSSHAQEALSLSLNRLVDDFSQQFDEAWRNIALLMKREPKLRGQMSVVEDKLRAQFQHFFETNGMLKIVEAIKELEEIHSPQSAPKEPSFNKDYTPILETYFEYDAYPSARDQEIIAERSGMSKKQINIWVSTRSCLRTSFYTLH